jgi:hypothetical protein
MNLKKKRQITVAVADISAVLITHITKELSIN